MSNNQDATALAIQSFANDITAIVRRAALDAVRAALGQAPARAAAAKPAAPAKKAAAPAPKAAAPKAAPAKAAAKAAPAKAAPAAKKAAPAAKRPLGAKRPPGEIVKLTEKVSNYIQSNPGQGVEVIGKALGTPTSELTLPIKKLLGAGTIRFEGQRRATRYFPV